MITSYIKSSLAELRDYVELNYEANASLSLDVRDDAFFETVMAELQKLEHKCDAHALHMKDELQDQIRFSELIRAELEENEYGLPDNAILLAC